VSHGTPYIHYGGLVRSLTSSIEVVIEVKINEDLGQEVRFMKNRSRDCS
jgi:hypothetical protein